MKNVIAVGSCLPVGGFSSQSWRVFIEMAQCRFDRIVLITRQSHTDLTPLVIGRTELLVEPSIDPEGGLNTFTLIKISPETLKMLTNANFDPTNGISHLYMFSGDACIASLESHDEMSFIIADGIEREDMYAAGFTQLLQGHRGALPEEFLDLFEEGDNWILWIREF